MPANEWKFWMDDGEMSRAPPGRMTELFQNNRRVFDALGRKVTVYDWDKEMAPGVTAVGTPGHSSVTPLTSSPPDGKNVFVQSDVSNNAFVFAPHPEWHGFFDQDGKTHDRWPLHGHRAGDGHAEGAGGRPRLSARLRRGDEGLGLRRRRAAPQPWSNAANCAKPACIAPGRA